MQSLPVGFRFDPTEDELIISYLRNMASGQPLPSDAILTADVYGTEPWNLLPQDEAEAYFFTRRTPRYTTGTRPARAAGRGTWSPYGKGWVISCGGGVVGLKRGLAFGVAERRNTGWVMYEYEIAFDSTTPQTSAFHDWVLCLVKKSVPSRSGSKEAASSGKRKRWVSESPTPGDAVIISSGREEEEWAATVAPPDVETTINAGTVDLLTHQMIMELADPAAWYGSSADDGTVMMIKSAAASSFLPLPGQALDSTTVINQEMMGLPPAPSSWGNLFRSGDLSCSSSMAGDHRPTATRGSDIVPESGISCFHGFTEEDDDPLPYIGNGFYDCIPISGP